MKSGNYCKIGFSKNKKAFFTRMRNYLTHNPVFQIIDLRNGDTNTEKEIHSLIPPDLYHYGEWCVWSKKIARIWLEYNNINYEDIDEYFYKRNKLLHKAIVGEYKNTLYLKLIRFFKKEPDLDLTEPPETVWRVS